MKKVYFIDCDSEFATDMCGYVNEKFDCGFNTRKEAIAYLIRATKEAKDYFAIGLKEEKEQGNTITLDCYKVLVEDDFDWEENYSPIFEHDHFVIESRYLCGRY